MQFYYNSLTPAEHELIEKFISNLTTNKHVIQIYLYGSREQGQSNELSDIDVAVIVDNKESIHSIEKAVEKWINLQEFFLLFHPIVLDKNSLMRSPIGYSIRQGKLLWLRK